MRVMVIRTCDDYLLNVRTTDELLDDGTFTDEDAVVAAEEHLAKCGIFYLPDAETYLKTQGETAR